MPFIPKFYFKATLKHRQFKSHGKSNLELSGRCLASFSFPSHSGSYRFKYHMQMSHRHGLVLVLCSRVKAIHWGTDTNNLLSSRGRIQIPAQGFSLSTNKHSKWLIVF